MGSRANHRGVSRSMKEKPPKPAAKCAAQPMASRDSIIPPIMSPRPAARAARATSSASKSPNFMSLTLTTWAARVLASFQASASEETVSSAATGTPPSRETCAMPSQSSLATGCS